MKNKVLEFLVGLQRYDLAALVKECEAEIQEIDVKDYHFGRQLVTEARIFAPRVVEEALTKLPQHDRKRLAEAIGTLDLSISTPDDISVKIVPDGVASPATQLLADLIIHREMMISVSTGGQRIQEVDDYYRAREARIKERLPPGAEYNNPHNSLWDWYNHWSANLPQYKDRRQYIRQMFGRTIEAVVRKPIGAQVEREPTGWERVDRTLTKARAQFETATAEEDCQQIGLLCREAIISLAQAVFDPSAHETLDGVAASPTDANRMLEAYVEHSMSGSSNKEVRQHARASLGLALNLQHRRTATHQLAALCLEATSSTVAVISIISRRGVE